MTGTRAVFDCMVFLQAAANPAGPAFACFEYVETGRLTLCLSPATLFEIGEVLSRPELQRRFPRLTVEAVATFLGQIQSRATMFDDVPKAFTLPRDPKDEPYTDLAIAAGARYLVTWNRKHFGYLMSDSVPEAEEFRLRFPDLMILDPVALLRELSPRAETSSDVDGGKNPNNS